MKITLEKNIKWYDISVAPHIHKVSYWYQYPESDKTVCTLSMILYVYKIFRMSQS